jgi:predicted nucleic acid-binding protein
MPDIVIADASVLIVFDKIGHLELLRNLYENIYTTKEVEKERMFLLPDWVLIKSPKDTTYKDFIQTQVDIGEASVIALAVENKNSLILLDDLKARKIAKNLNLKFTGTLGVLNKAKEIGKISKLKPVLTKLQETNFRISESIVNDLLLRNGE